MSWFLLPTIPLVGAAAELCGTLGLVGSISLLGIGYDTLVCAMRANNFPSSHSWMGAFASEAARLNEGNGRAFLGRSFVLAKGAFGLAWIGGDNKGGCSTGGDA